MCKAKDPKWREARASMVQRNPKAPPSRNTRHHLHGRKEWTFSQLSPAMFHVHGDREESKAYLGNEASPTMVSTIADDAGGHH